MTDLPTAVVHGIRLGGLSPIESIVARSGLSPSEVEATLITISDAGWATLRSGRMPGWMLTKEGRLEGERLLAVELDATGRRGDLVAAYDDFLPHNREFLGLCTDWQLRDVDGDAVVNDHDDPEHDRLVIERLDALHAELAPLLDRMTSVLPRMAAYAPRFNEALQRVHQGELEWFTKPIIDSYHTVWFELHEDLLATLGIERSSEVAR